MRGKLTLPTSKSIANRLLILRAISQGNLQIVNLSDSEDTRRLSKVLKILSDSEEFIYNLDLGNCGTCVRFLTAFLSLVPGVYILNGNMRMQRRPIAPLVEALRSLGAKIAYVNEEGYPPIYIDGGYIHGGRVEIDCSISSQFASALMLIAPALEQGAEIIVKGLNSAPYLEMTYLLMKSLGINLEKIGSYEYKIPHQVIPQQQVKVSADWSSASFWYAFAALAKDAELFINDLIDCGLQGDRIIYQIYDKLGVKTSFTNRGVLLTKKKRDVDYLEMDLRDYPDIALPLIVNLVLLGVDFKLSGLAHLRYKESDRLKAINTELGKLGVKLNVSEQGVVSWHKQKIVFPAKVRFNTYDDHRIAMSLAQIAMFTDVDIENAEVVRKSYPNFWSNLSKIKT